MEHTYKQVYWLPKHIILAVYGTLRKGCGNSSFLNGQKYLKTITLKGYKMIVPSYIPFVVKGEDKDEVVIELYEVNHVALRKIDQLEGHPNWYKRVKIPNTNFEMYLYPDKWKNKIMNGKIVKDFTSVSL